MSRIAQFIGLLIGCLSLLTACSIPKEPNRIIVSVEYPGASAQEIQELCLSKIESVCTGLPHLETRYSSAQTHTGEVILSFSPELDPRENLIAVHDAVSTVTSFPLEMEPPRISRARNHSLAYSVSPTPTEPEISEASFERLADLIEARPHITMVEMVGWEKPQCEIRYEWQVLRLLGITPWDLSEQLKRRLNGQFNLLTGGDSGNVNHELQIAGKFSDVSELLDLLIKMPSGKVLSLSQIAEVYVAISEAQNPSLDIWVENGYKDDLQNPLGKLLFEELGAEGGAELIRLSPKNHHDYLSIEIMGQDPEKVEEMATDLAERIPYRFSFAGIRKFPERAEVKQLKLDRAWRGQSEITTQELANAIQVSYQRTSLGTYTFNQQEMEIVLVPADPPPTAEEIGQAIRPNLAKEHPDLPSAFTWTLEKEEKLLSKNGMPYALLVINPINPGEKTTLRKNLKKFIEEELDTGDLSVTVKKLEYDAFEFFE